MAHELQIVKVRSAYYAPDYQLTPRELYWNSGNGFRYSNCFSWNDEDFHNGVDSSNTEYDDYYIGNGSPEKAASSSSKRADFFIGLGIGKVTAYFRNRGVTENVDTVTSFRASVYKRIVSTNDSLLGGVKLSSSASNIYAEYTFYSRPKTESSWVSTSVKGLTARNYIIAIPPKKTGTKFLGWFVDGVKVNTTDSAKAVYVSSSDQYQLNVSYTSAADYEIVAKYGYTVSFNANGGTGSMPAQEFASKESANIRKNAFTRYGYTFMGWATSSDGEVQYKDKESLEVKSTITLYAVWAKDFYRVSTSTELPDSVTGDDPSITVSPSAQIEEQWLKGTSMSVVAQTEKLNAIRFSSWDIEGLTVDDPTANPLSFTMPDNDVKLTAVYELRPLTVNHGMDEASKVATSGNTSLTDSDGSAVDSFVYGTEVVFHAPDPTEGYYFSGWYNGNERVSQNRNYTVVLTGDISLLARYSTDVTVSKNEDGGTGYISVDGVGYESSAAVSIRKELGASMQIAAVATSGAFGGWYGGESILELFRDDTVVITGKSTYAARFIAEAVTVQVKCQSVKNSDTDDGALGTLALAGPGVTDNGNGSYSVEGFTEVVLTATQADGGLPLFRVVEEVGEVESEIDISKPIWILSSDRTFIARWGSKGKFLVQVSSADNAAGMAYIGESAAVTSLTGEQDSTVTITALPSNGYRFVGWYEGDRLVSEKARYSFSLVDPVSLQARFAEDAAAICVWEGSGENKRLSWKSKVFVMPRPFDPVAARVDAVGYPVSLSVGTYSSPDAVPTRDHDVQVQNQAGRRLPRMRAERFLRISVESAHEVDSVVVATNLVEVN